MIYTDAWRWACVEKHRNLIEAHILDPRQNGIDFGGYKGPIGGCTRIIDKELHNSIYDEEYESLDYIFTSHTLEHVDDVWRTLGWMYDILKKGGKIIIHVPSYQKRVWRHTNDPDHNYTFKLKGTDFEPADEIDTLVKKIGFKIIEAEYCYKCCIFIYGLKKEQPKYQYIKDNNQGWVKIR